MRSRSATTQPHFHWTLALVVLAHVARHLNSMDYNRKDRIQQRPLSKRGTGVRMCVCFLCATRMLDKWDRLRRNKVREIKLRATNHERSHQKLSAPESTGKKIRRPRMLLFRLPVRSISGYGDDEVQRFGAGQVSGECTGEMLIEIDTTRHA